MLVGCTCECVLVGVLVCAGKNPSLTFITFSCVYL